MPEPSEWAAELTYSIVVHAALSLRPNVPVYRHPGGRSDRQAMVVFGLGSFATL